MKDLHINQKSIINGVKRLTRGLCRVSSKVKNTNHILIFTLMGSHIDNSENSIIMSFNDKKIIY